MKKLPIIIAAALALASCGGRNAPAPFTPAAFPQVQVPGVLEDPSECEAYVLEHYWDAFFELEGPSDTTYIQGVPVAEVEQALANYIMICEGAPLPKAQAGILRAFELAEKAQQRDTSSRVYRLTTEMVSKYLYDPNSPMRNEDLYLPWVRAAAVSPCTAENMREAYRYEARMCSLNQFGSYVPDFKIRDARGTVFTLYSVKAEYTMLFFSNPGCAECKNIVDQVMSRSYVNDAIASKKLAVVNVYIDEDRKAWRSYVKNYPSSWRSGYDPKLVIRTDELYNVRAIPSLYLLDKSKRVIMKDAPTEKVMMYLDKTLAQ